ncbi:DegT/DnrJ/EryC1/StrS family aminotransferase [Streptococcus sp. 121]|uniref:DegT/DnrJ/EryC1/StrS family aminotransferase n=1 Tax=Streptococcus sp. 121 TaxID=2797637 RepID=UPI0018F0CAA2|nr:DegT/DnrJ/EryC1/StrS family aminotransferase [Streptococcus sp. 121]MBJ6746595.1 DegT/DnrJ/EryC1/StrS family aminotransferase [Streptococcus sp. 121]
MSNLAILGAEPRFNNPLNFLKPQLVSLSDSEYGEYFNEVFKTGILSKGRFLEKYEDQVGEYLSVPYVSAVSSGTIGLILTLEALGIGKGDEVIVPSFTFCATVHAIEKVGANPVFVDCDLKTFTLSTDDLEIALSNKTKAIMGVHIFGVSADVYKLEKFAKKHNIKLIFDAAHAFGSTIDGTALGRFGDVSVYSTSPTKTLVTGEGGLVVTKDKEIDNKIKLLREYGNPGDYDCTVIGINGRLGELAAITGLMSLSELESNLNVRERIGNYYIKQLSGVKGITTQFIPENCFSTFKDLAILIDESEFGLDRDSVVRCLNLEGIPTRNYFFPPVHKMKCYTDFSKLELVNTEQISNNILCLPMHPYIKESDIDLIVEILNSISSNSSLIKEVLITNVK